MDLGARLLELREERRLSQGELEQRTGLLRCYISRLEHGYTSPSVETLEKLSHAFDLKLYQLLYDGEAPPKRKEPPKDKRRPGESRRAFRQRTGVLPKLRKLLPKIGPSHRELLMVAAMQMARSKNRRAGR
jgi:transcriptional regulator with XRE-family HTH domain